MAAMLLCVFAAMAQTPAISYQAVLRDASNRLVVNTNGIQVNVVVKNGQTSVFSETHTNVSTNPNGLISIEIGNGLNPHGSLSAVDWTNAQVLTSIKLPGTTEWLDFTGDIQAVPYALYANNVSHNATEIVALYNKATADSLVLANRIVADSGALRKALKDTAIAIRNSISTAGGNITLTNLCSSIENTCSNVALQSANNTFSGNNTLTGSNTYSGSNDFTGGTTTVASGYTFGTTSATCGNVAVNACDLVAVFDSIQRQFAVMQQRINAIQDTLHRLRAATLPVFNNMNFVKTENSLQVTATFFDGGATITNYNFCISTSPDMSSASCQLSNTSSYTFTGLNPGTDYYVTVAATNLKGTTVSTAQATSTKYAAPELSDPVNVVLENNTEIGIEGSVISLGGNAPVNVKVCAYLNSDYSDTPVCGLDSVITTAPKNYRVNVGGLTKNTHYYLAVIADNGHKRDTVKTDATTLNITISVTSSATDTIAVCGTSDTVVTYTATVVGDTPTTYAWKVNGADSTAVTGNRLTIRYNALGTNKVVCTVNSGSDTAVTVIKAGAEATLGLCEDCNANSITMKAGNCTSIQWVNNADPSKTATTTAALNQVVLTVSVQTPAGIYTAMGSNADGCTVTRIATLGNATTHPCTVSSKNSNESGNTETTIDSVKDSQDNWYRVVQIGTGANAQCWLAENMRCTQSPKGGLSQGSSQSSTNPYYYDYSPSIMSLRERGYLYNWPGAMDTTLSSQPGTVDFVNRQGICPDGWHIPTYSEWSTMATNAGVGFGSGGSGLGKLANGCKWSSNSNATCPGNYSYEHRNSTGFSAVPTGRYSGNYQEEGNQTEFWTASSSETSNAWPIYLYANKNNLCKGSSDGGTLSVTKNLGAAVRCVRNTSGITIGVVTKTDSTTNTLSISAAYTATNPVTSATICAYTDAACTQAAGTCAAHVTYASSPITGTITGLSVGMQYYVKVTATTAGGTESTIAGPFGTGNVTMSITSDPESSSLKLCGASTVKVTYTATVSGSTPSSYNWTVTGGTGSSTTNTLVVTAGAGTISVTCTAAGVSATKTTTVATGGTAAFMDILEDYATPSVNITSTNCTTSTLVWKNSSNDIVLTGSTTLNSTTAPGVTNGYYTVSGVNTINCAISRTVHLGASTVGCPGTPNANETATDGFITEVRDHQGHSYAVVSIGGFCMMKQNLRVTTSPAGRALSSSWSSSTTTSYYKQNTTFGDEGYVYNWRAALDTTVNVSNINSGVVIANRRGLCPQGWHLPTNKEWTSIVNSHDAGQFAAPNGSYTGTNWTTSTTANTPGYNYDTDKNITGFSGVPVGYLYSGSFTSPGSYGYFWSASPYSTGSNGAATYQNLSYSNSAFSQQNINKKYGLSIRCVRNY